MTAAASSGFFCAVPGRLFPLKCYDCGLVVVRRHVQSILMVEDMSDREEGDGDDDDDEFRAGKLDLFHAAALLRYVAAYRRSSALLAARADIKGSDVEQARSKLRREDTTDGSERRNVGKAPPASSSERHNPDLVRDAFSKLIAVKPRCQA